MSHTTASPSPRRSKWSSIATLGALALGSWLPSVEAAKSAADYFITSLPGAPSPLLKMYAGHLEVTPEHHGNMFFWLYKNRHIANKQRTVLWLNGGPGCSSMDGALMEIGPYRVNENGTLRLQDGSWDEFANVLFVDNPVGTGFSYVDTDSYVHELDEMASQMVTFLDNWFKIFPEHAQDDLYIAGESYAGQHIPYIAKAIQDRNAKTQTDKWNLAGLLIGNGWISGEDQYSSYIQLGYEAGIVTKGSDIDRDLLKMQDECNRQLKNGGSKHVDTGACESVMMEMLRLTRPDGMCWNMYDVRLKDEYPSCGMNWPPDLAQLTPYLRRDDVKKALHINADKKTGWEECNSQVSANFRAQTSKPSKVLLPGLLEQMPIILFSGDKDLICNHIGTEELINNLEWNGAKGMELADGTWAPKRDWSFEGEPAGIYQTARNLTYIKFYNSSHMVPFDYPRRTRDMLDRFMGVDIASIGGTPADSRIDGEKGKEVTVGGHTNNSTAATEVEKDKVKAATWAAYKRSGEVALFFVIVAALAWGFFVYRDRRRRAGYRNVFGAEPYNDRNASQLSTGLGLDGRRQESRWRENRDVEAARDFDEAELDELTEEGKERDSRFELGDDDEEDDVHQGKAEHSRG